jgi:glycosyltransferase involved in cell wall biosynthesis
MEMPDSEKAFLAKLHREIRNFAPDILICSLYHSSILGSVLGRVNGVRKIVSWEHSGHLGSWHRRLGKRLVDKLAWKVFCDSQKVLDEYAALTQSSKSVLVPIGGVDISLFKPAKKPHKGAVVASVGRLERIKGYDLLIESVRELAAETPEVEVRIAGVGPEIDTLKQRIHEYGLDKNMCLDGLVRDIPGYLAEADIYVQPSRNEGQCVSVVEAMACGLPILAAGVGGLMESVGDGINGFLVDPADVKTWNSKLRILIQDKELRQKMGAKSREIAVSKYNIKNTIKVVKKELETDDR